MHYVTTCQGSSTAADKAICNAMWQEQHSFSFPSHGSCSVLCYCSHARLAGTDAFQKSMALIETFILPAYRIQGGRNEKTTGEKMMHATHIQQSNAGFKRIRAHTCWILLLLLLLLLLFIIIITITIQTITITIYYHYYYYYYFYYYY